MSLAAESPSPAPSSSSGSDDFAALLDSELELASAVDSASPDDPSTSLTSSDDEEEEDAVVEVEDAGQSRYEICNPHFVPDCWACLLRLCDQELPFHDSTVECATLVLSLADLIHFYLAW
jgi:hypothetical protein